MSTATRSKPELGPHLLEQRRRPRRTGGSRPPSSCAPRRSRGGRVGVAGQVVRDTASGVDVPGRRRDHGRVVGAELGRRQGQPDAQLAAAARRRVAQDAVPGDAADDRQGRRRPWPRPPRRPARPGRGRSPPGRRRPGRPARRRRRGRRERSAVFRPLNEKSWPGRPTIAAGKRVRRRVAAGRELLERRAARIAEAEQAGALVERLARRVVEAAADAPSSRRRRLHRREQRVAARREQRQERRLDRIGLEVEGGDVAVQVVRRARAAGGGRTPAPSRPRGRRGARRSAPAPR